MRFSRGVFFSLLVATFAVGITSALQESIRINAGDNVPYTDKEGNVWSADQYYNKGSTFDQLFWISNTKDRPLYRSNRYDADDDDPKPLTYDIPVESGSYEVKLHFAELYTGALEKGARVFHVKMEGKTVFSNVDIFDQAGGGYTALIKTTTAGVQVTDGSLTIEFVRQVEHPEVSAIEIHPILDEAVVTSAESSPDDVEEESANPSEEPSWNPSLEPSSIPSSSPSKMPSRAPTKKKKEKEDSSDDEEEPSSSPSLLPSRSPSDVPSLLPSGNPSQEPSVSPTASPTIKKTKFLSTTTSPAPTGDTPFDPIHINAGGESFTDVEGTVWEADAYYNSGAKSRTSVDQVIVGAVDSRLYQTDRWDSSLSKRLRYDIPVPEGEYKVTLHFSENYKKLQKPMGRVFDVEMEGKIVFGRLDIFTESGGPFTALKKTTTVPVTDGSLTIEFVNEVQSPKVSGIEIYALSASPFSPTVSASAITNQPSLQPSLLLSDTPSVRPSLLPSVTPSEDSWSDEPSRLPTLNPTANTSTQVPSDAPSSSLTTKAPTAVPTDLPSLLPSMDPSTTVPSSFPSLLPTSKPTKTPTPDPVAAAAVPTPEPTPEQTGKPTNVPSEVPSFGPSLSPSLIPTMETVSPSGLPSTLPTDISAEPSSLPSATPTSAATGSPTEEPTMPSTVPTMTVSDAPSDRPTSAPTTSSPSEAPSKLATDEPTREPSLTPSSHPTAFPFGVDGFVLVDADTNKDLEGALVCNPVNDCVGSATDFNIRASTFGDNIQSVTMSLEGPVADSRIEENAPYAIFGDSSGNYNGQTLLAGSYTITAFALNAKGDVSQNYTVNFNVADAPSQSPSSQPSQAPSPTPTKRPTVAPVAPVAIPTPDPTVAPTNAPSYSPSKFPSTTPSSLPSASPFGVDGFVLVNADTNKDIEGALECEPINKCIDSTVNQFNIRASTFGDNIQGVSLSLTGPMSDSRTEETAPYALLGDNNGDYNGASFPAGSYTITAFAVSSQGIASQNYTLTFEIVDEPSQSPSSLPSFIPSAGPTKAPVAPVAAPTRLPTPIPTESPTRAPTPRPSPAPSPRPNPAPTALPFGVSGFVLVNADSNEDIVGALACEPINDCIGNAKNFSIRADVFGSNIQGVDMALSGPVSDARVEQNAPYAIFGDFNGDYNGQALLAGSYTITAFAFKAQGAKSEVVSVMFEVSDAPSQSPSRQPSDAPSPRPTRFPTPAPVTPVAIPTPAPTPFLTTRPTASPTPAPTPKPTSSPTVSPTPSPTAVQSAAAIPFSTIRLNAGGSEFIDKQGNLWEADKYFGGGKTYETSQEITGTADQSLYETERYEDAEVAGELVYDIPVPNGSYIVSLLFADIFEGTHEIGARMFDIKINGYGVFKDVDIYSEAGGFRPLTKQAPAIVSDGSLTIELIPVKENPKISAIMIEALGTAKAHTAHAVSSGPYFETDTDGNNMASVLVDGSFSHTHGPGATLDSFKWTIDGKVVSTKEIDTLELAIGTYNLTLEVIDSHNDVSKDSTTVTIRSSIFPDIESLTPNSGSVAGGGSVVISGSGFTATASETTVYFGRHPVTGSSITIIDDGKIEVKAPPAASGSVQVRVATPVGESNSVVYTYVNGMPVAFSFGNILEDVYGPTCIATGPDGNIYVGTQTGSIIKLILNDEYQVIGNVTSYKVARSDTTFRSILGITFDPMDTSAYPDVYVSHSTLFHGKLESYNGKVSKVSGQALDQIFDLITGLPVSDLDHGVNGLEFGDNGELYVQVGANTNAGVPGNLSSTGQQADAYFSGATLVAHLSRPGYDGNITYENGDQVSGFDVEIFASGQRNSFDICLHSNGNLYATDNGPNTGFGKKSVDCFTEEVDPSEKDELNLIERGKYYGSANRKRGETNPNECRWRSSSSPSDAEYSAPIAMLESSTNGIIEWQSDHFYGQLRGDLILGRYKGPLYHAELASNGRSVLRKPRLLNKKGGLSLTQGPDGTLFVVKNEDGQVFYLSPDERITSPVLDIKSVFPRRGPMSGGSILTVYGQNLNIMGSPRVTVGGKLCNPVGAATERKVSCRLPSGTGTVDIVVSSGSQSDTFARGYRYISGTEQ